jgi:hypothetical protein
MTSRGCRKARKSAFRTLKGRGFSRAAVISKGFAARLEAVPFQNSIAMRVFPQLLRVMPQAPQPSQSAGGGQEMIAEVRRTTSAAEADSFPTVHRHDRGRALPKRLPQNRSK